MFTTFKTIIETYKNSYLHRRSRFCWWLWFNLIIRILWSSWWQEFLYDYLQLF